MCFPVWAEIKYKSLKNNNLTAAVFSDEKWSKAQQLRVSVFICCSSALIQHRTAAIILRMSLWKSETVWLDNYV